MTDENIKENIESLKERIEYKGIIMSRVPEPCRSEFKEFAKKEFSDDFGMCLKFLWDYFKFNNVLENLDIKINYIIELLTNKKEKEEDKKEISFLDGRKISINKKIEEEKKND